MSEYLKMENKNKFISPSTDEEMWASPMDLYLDKAKKEGGLLMSTPVEAPWQSLSSSLEDSDVSRQQDSGYSSLTPSTSTSFSDGELFNKKCPWCSKMLNYEQRSPGTICNCKKKLLPKNQSSHLKYMQTISEMKFSPSEPFLLQCRPNTMCDLFEEPLETSLYPDELVAGNPPSESHGCLVGSMEIGEEKSIDFMDTTLYLLKKKSSDSGVFEENETGKESEVGVPFGAGSAQSSFSCGSRSPVVMNHTTPTKLDRIGSKSPLVKNQTTSTKLDKANNFPYVTKKVVSINKVIKSFSLNGIEKTDILYQLTSKRLNCPHIVIKIFSYLSDKDLNSVAYVSKSWNKLVRILDVSTCNRWKAYKRSLQLRRENNPSYSTKEDSPAWRSRDGPLGIVQMNVNENPPRRSSSSSSPRVSPPVSPQSARFRSFQKAAKTLKKGERLLQCPRCFFPSLDRGSPTLQCSRSGCRHRFCVWCRSEIIASVDHNCPPSYTPRPQRSSSYKIASVGSKTCKRKLRRLTFDL